MQALVGFLIILRHVTACSAEAGDVCLLQLRNGESPSVGQSEQNLPVADRVPGTGNGALAVPELTLTSAAGKLRSEDALGKTEVDHEVTRAEDEAPPHAPAWEDYPSGLADILETLVVTRWNGDAKPRHSSGLSSPVPALYKKFDCVRHDALQKVSHSCRTLLVENKIEIMKDCADDIEDGKLDVTSGDFVVFLGTDHYLSDPGYLKLAKRIGKHFQKTYYEAYDVMDEDIDVLPIGLSEYYLRFQDWNTLSKLAQNLPPKKSHHASAKAGMVLGAFGAFFNVENPSRESAGELCKAHASETWLTCETIPKDKWWSTLRRFRFILNPSGGGVQSSKFYEALLTLTIPICTKEPAFEKLHAKGWPMVLVDDFAEVEHLNLSKIYQELRPRLESIRQYLHVDAYWDYLNTGNL